MYKAKWMSRDIATVEVDVVLNFTFTLVCFLKRHKQVLDFFSQGSTRSQSRAVVTVAFQKPH